MIHFGRPFVILALIMSTQLHRGDAFWLEAAGAVAGVTAVTVGAPFVLAGVGFGAGGIGAGTVAAKMMGLAASTGYGAGVVATLQSVGAAGVGVATTVAGGLTGAGAGHVAKHFTEDTKKKNNNN